MENQKKKGQKVVKKIAKKDKKNYQKVVKSYPKTWKTDTIYIVKGHLTVPVDTTLLSLSL